jgi:hypothetical protein
MHIAMSVPRSKLIYCEPVQHLLSKEWTGALNGREALSGAKNKCKKAADLSPAALTNS